MLYGEIIAVCSQIHTKHVNTLCGQNVELLNLNLWVRIVTARPWTIRFSSYKFPYFRDLLTGRVVLIQFYC